jgi:adenine-specific DNA-methyltransferase
VSYKEFIFLLASLLKAASKYANTTGTFRAHLKHLSKKAARPLVLVPIHKDLRVARRADVKRCDVNTFVKGMEGVDIVYIDPPYNCVHYSAYYSFLNYLCLYDSRIELVGTGIIKDYYKSKLGIVKTAYGEIKSLLDAVSTKTRHIIFSYNSNGAIPIATLIHLIKRYGKITVNRFPYKKYQSNKTASLKQNSVSEYIITCQVL